MCCRYCMELSPELRPYIEAAKSSPLTEKYVDRLARQLVTEGEVHPTDLVPVIAPNRSQVPSVYPMVWGFHLPRSSSPLINARSESAADRPTFRDAWERRRCVIPATCYFEWEHFTSPEGGKAQTGSKYMIQPAGSTLTFLAGLYRIEEIRGLQIPVFTILTRDAAEEIRFIHDRMPVILPEEAIKEWIDPKADPFAVLRRTHLPMVYERV